jgi:transposase InsO family protein
VRPPEGPPPRPDDRQQPRHPIALNRLAEAPKATAPNQIWVADITYIETKQGWLYLAGVLDLYSRKIVGWAMSERIDTNLVLSALDSC